MLIHGKPGIFLRCKDMTCLLNDTFNLVVFSDYSAVKNKKVHSVGFAVPVKYEDFIKKISPDFTINSNLKEIFKFEKEEDFKKLQNFLNLNSSVKSNVSKGFSFKRK